MPFETKTQKLDQSLFFHRVSGALKNESKMKRNFSLKLALSLKKHYFFVAYDSALRFEIGFSAVRACEKRIGCVRGVNLCRLKHKIKNSTRVCFFIRFLGRTKMSQK